MNDESRKHRPQSADRNDNYVMKLDKPAQKKRDKKAAEGEKKMDELSKRDEGIR